MKVHGRAPVLVQARADAFGGLVPADAPGPHGVAAARLADLPGAFAEEPFKRVAWLAATILGTPLAFVTIAGEFSSCGADIPGAPDVPGRPSPAEQALCQSVIDSGDKLVLRDTRLDPQMSVSCRAGAAGVAAWAGFPVRDPDGRVAGALCVADHLPRHWSSRDMEVLETLAQVAAGEVALQAALRHGAERAALAQTLQESLLPPRLPDIPGLEVAARYTAGGTGAEVLGDFYDVFPSVRGSWGMVVGDVCGKGVPAAKSTALARYTVRAQAHRQMRPSLILAALNQALLDWFTDQPRFLTAVYATVRSTAAGASVQISSAGHPLALVRRADGRVQEFGRPGTLLGLVPDLELHDSRIMLRAGDSLIMFTDGVTEARSHIDRDLYGDRLRGLIAGLGDMSAARMAEAIQQATLSFSGGKISDDSVALVLMVPWRDTNGSQGAGRGNGHATRAADGHGNQDGRRWAVRLPAEQGNGRPAHSGADGPDSSLALGLPNRRAARP
jgi:sigma-B regulation protein RsbU (phosphoserine phosphatase)